MIIKMKWKIGYKLLFVVILLFTSSNVADEQPENVTNNILFDNDYENVTLDETINSTLYANETTTDDWENVTSTTSGTTKSNYLNETTLYYNETISSTMTVIETTEIPSSTQSSTENVTDHDADDVPDRANKCHDGLLLKVWKPNTNLKFGDKLARGMVYFVVLCYLFLGVSIVSDRFMSAIEVITAEEKEVKVRRPDGTTQTVVVRVWNETVANLTLMALGTSAPEILLSVIEIFAQNFKAGELGPGTIVGSAAYNLFTIIGLCIWVIPNGETRRIKHLRVFFVTATWSMFAYIWLYLILDYFSVGVVTVGEGFLTFLFFPLTVGTAYIADRKLYKYLSKEYRMNERGIMVQTEASTSSELKRFSIKDQEEELVPDDFKDFEQTKNEYIAILKELKRKYPQHDRERIEVMAQEQLLSDVPKSRAFYRIQATRKMVGGGNIMKKLTDRVQVETKSDLQAIDVLEDETVSKIFFDPAKYHVMENCGEMELRVARRGGFSRQVRVDYETEDGSAEAGADYIPKHGTLIFAHGVEEQFIRVGIIDDDVFEQDECFFVRLSSPSIGAILAAPKIATVMILDDDHCGVFSFNDEMHNFNESIGTYELKVQRSSGARGDILLPYWTEDGTAKAGKDYEAQRGELLFENNECIIHINENNE